MKLTDKILNEAANPFDKLKWQPSKVKGFEYTTVKIPHRDGGTVAGLATKFRNALGVSLPVGKRGSYDEEFSVRGYSKKWRVYSVGEDKRGGTFIIQRPIESVETIGDVVKPEMTWKDLFNQGETRIMKKLSSSINKMKGLDKRQKDNFYSFIGSSFGLKDAAQLAMNPVALKKEWDEFNNYEE